MAEPFNFTIMEMRLVRAFRCLPSDVARESVMDAIVQHSKGASRSAFSGPAHQQVQTNLGTRPTCPPSQAP